MLLIDVPLASISQQVSEQLASSPALFGAAVYVSSFAALTVWETQAVPRLKRRGIMPDVPTLPSMMTEEEKMTPFATPLTAISYPPLPALEELRDGRRHLVDTSGRMTQHIYLMTEDVSLREEVCTVSDEFSDFYEEPIVIEKGLMI